jgi:hypothetical protein
MRGGSKSIRSPRCFGVAALLCAALAAELAVTPRGGGRLGLWLMWRLVRNTMLADTPADVPFRYSQCTPTELVRQVTVVVTAKDTCSQTPQTFAELTRSFPREMPIIYVYPSYPGCDRSLPDRALFERVTIVEISSTASPNEGFLRAAGAIATPYALLMHNDVTPLDGLRTVCEMYRALAARPSRAFVAPQIYERGDNGIMVPHAHFRNLHRNAVGTVAYELDWDVLTRRRPNDFVEEEQPDYLEDHAYLARSDPRSDLHYAQFIDARASFTMEYLDSVLNLRARGAAAPWFVPTARVLFDVSARRVQHNDLPYFSFKRSEETGLQVRAYLAAKWNASFANTGIWNYVRCSYLADVRLLAGALPSASDDAMHRALYYAWFQSVGFNRFDGRPLHEFLATRSAHATTHISRVTNLARCEAVGAGQLSDYVPQQAAGGINVSVRSRWAPIHVERLEGECRAERCGLLAIVDGRCHCWHYAVPCELGRGGRVAEALLDALRLPSRALRYVSLAQSAAPARATCAEDEPCALRVPAYTRGRVLQWAWAPATPSR